MLVVNHTWSLSAMHAHRHNKCYNIGWVQVYEGQWQGRTVAIKVLDGAAAASQKAMKEVDLSLFFHNLLQRKEKKEKKRTLYAVRHHNGQPLYPEAARGTTSYYNDHIPGVEVTLDHVRCRVPTQTPG